MEGDFSCPICFELMTQPVTLACGHNYCKKCCIKVSSMVYLRWRCPTCRASVSKTTFRVNCLLADVIRRSFPEHTEVSDSDLPQVQKSQSTRRSRRVAILAALVCVFGFVLLVKHRHRLLLMLRYKVPSSSASVFWQVVRALLEIAWKIMINY
jgi:hypothetical protein